MFLTKIGLLQLVENIAKCIFTHILNLHFKSRNFQCEKRAEASFGLYTQLLLHIKNLQSWLDDIELLEITDSGKGNIYTLVYNKKTQKKECPGFKEPSDELLNDLKKLSSQIKNIFVNSKDNVYPKDSEKIRWYSSQQKLLDFCEFLENKGMRGITNIAKADGEYKHIVKCRELVNAMNYIKESIEKEITNNKYM